MGIVIFQIIKWILLICLLLILLFLGIVVVILIVPIRYHVEGEYSDSAKDIKGRISWLAGMISCKVQYEDAFHFAVKVFGFSVYRYPTETDSKDPILKKEGELETEKEILENNLETTEIKNIAEPVKTEEIGSDKKSETSNNTTKDKKKKTFFHKQKSKENKNKEKKNSFDIKYFYNEIWKKEETQITFWRAKNKLLKVIKSVLPRKWYLKGELGFEDPAATGRFMAIRGILYPVLGNAIQITPNFERKIIDIKGKLKGHIRLGNLCWQMISLLLNKHTFAFIKLIFREMKHGKKKEKQEG